MATWKLSMILMLTLFYPYGLNNYIIIIFITILSIHVCMIDLDVFKTVCICMYIYKQYCFWFNKLWTITPRNNSFRRDQPLHPSHFMCFLLFAQL